MAEGKFVISAQNKIKEGLDGAKKDLLGFEDAATKVGKTIQNALTVAAIAQGLKKLGEAAFDCFKEFAEGERRLTQLKLALNGNEASFTKATTLIDDMRKMSLASKDDIEGLVAELAALGKSDAEIEAITTAAVNLSNVTGKDLNSSFTLINATYAGTTGRLTQLLPEIGNLTKEELAAGGATKAINDRFTELSQTLANGDALQGLKDLKDSFGDLKENMGELTAGVFSGFTSLLSDFVENLNTAFGKYKAFLGAKNALNFEDKAKNLLISKGYYELDTTAAGKAVRDRVNFLMQEAKRQDPGIQGPELNRKVEALKLNDSSYQAAVAWAADVAEKLKGINTQLDKIKAETGIDYKTTFNAGPLREDTGGGSGGSNSPASYAFNPAAFEVANVSATFADDIASTLANIGTLDFRSLAAEELDRANFNALGTDRGNSLDFRSLNIDEMDVSNFDALGSAFAKSLKFEPNTSDADDSANLAALTDLGQQINARLLDFRSYSKEEMDTSNFNALGTGGSNNLDFRSLAIEDMDVANFNALDTIGEKLLNFSTNVSDADDAANFDALDVIGEHLLNFATNVSDSEDAANFNALGSTGTSEFDIVLSQITAGMTGAFDVATVGLDSFGAALGPSMGMLMEALGPFGQMIAGMNPALALLVPVIEGFVSVIGPAINEVLAPLFNTLTQIGQMLGAALLPILDALMPIFSLIANILIVAFAPILQMLTPIIQVIALVFQMMTPILVMLTKVFLVLMSPIQYIADLFSWLGGVIKTFAWNIAHPFRQEGYSGFSSDAFSGLADRIAAVDAMGANNQTLTASYSQSDATATQSANYRTQPITVNIYQQAPVVGDDGMQEFARMIRGEIEMLAYAGA